VIDTGTLAISTTRSGFPFGTWLKLKSLAGEFEAGEPAASNAGANKRRSANLRWQSFRTVHLDHAGGLMDLPPMPVMLTREEVQFANDPKDRHRAT